MARDITRSIADRSECGCNGLYFRKDAKSAFAASFRLDRRRQNKRGYWRDSARVKARAGGLQYGPTIKFVNALFRFRLFAVRQPRSRVMCVTGCSISEIADVKAPERRRSKWAICRSLRSVNRGAMLRGSTVGTHMSSKETAGKRATLSHVES
jgi:hypothetical protein